MFTIMDLMNFQGPGVLSFFCVELLLAEYPECEDFLNFCRHGVQSQMFFFAGYS